MSPIIATDYIHSVIEADRTIYSKMIVERLGDAISLKATENYLQENDSLNLSSIYRELANSGIKKTMLQDKIYSSSKNSI